MASSHDNVSMAVFCDFENVALGVRDAKYEKFDIKPVLERLLLKGSIVVKKAYCDWERYKGFKATMHEANFELIEIPHVRQSGKNSADIRLVVDALDLCYTKSHVNTFVIISGDSDFSPLVSKLRENAKQVIGVGVKQSTSDLLIANCDEFIFYDDLVRESRRAAAKRDGPPAQPAAKRTPEEETRRKESLDVRRNQAIGMAVETFDALVSERGDSGKIWASMLKEAIKRRKPDFSETYYGFRTFGNLLEEAQARGLLEFGRDDKSGAYVYRSTGSAVNMEAVAEAPAHRGAETMQDAAQQESAQAEEAGQKHEPRRKSRGGRKVAAKKAEYAAAHAAAERASEEPWAHAAGDVPAALPAPEPVAVPVDEQAPTPARKPAARGRRTGKAVEAAAAAEPAVEQAPTPAEKKKPARKPAAKKSSAAAEPKPEQEEAAATPARGRRPRKAKTDNS